MKSELIAEESAGLSLSQLAEFMKCLGVVTAYNLDGGGSSTMYFNGEIINNPTTNGRSIKERSVSDIVYIGYKPDEQNCALLSVHFPILYPVWRSL